MMEGRKVTYLYMLNMLLARVYKCQSSSEVLKTLKRHGAREQRTWLGAMLSRNRKLILRTPSAKQCYKFYDKSKFPFTRNAV